MHLEMTSLDNKENSHLFDIIQKSCILSFHTNIAKRQICGKHNIYTFRNLF